MAVAKELPVFRVGDAWLDVKMALHVQSIRPIYADALLMEIQLEHVYLTARNVLSKQQDLYKRRVKNEAKEEATFFASVLYHKEQAIQLRKKSSVQTISMKSHFEAKKRKAEMKILVHGKQEGHNGYFKDPPPLFNDLL